jgi:predicted transposase/invertase (TIGR01784 family)
MRCIKTTDGREILLPKSDFLFKLIFGDKRNEGLLKSFLQAILGLPEEEFEVEFLDTHLKPEFYDDKLCVIDIRIKTKTGKQIDIEMQVAKTVNLFERICYYLAKMMYEQLGEGETYKNVKKVISIIVADFCFIEGGDAKRYHHRYRLHDGVDDTYFGDVEEIHALELSKLPADSDETGAWEWAKFISVGSEEELEMIAAQNEVMKGAVKELYRVSSDADVRRQYELREKAWRDEQARTEYALQTGEAKGREEGRAEGREEGRAEGREKGREEERAEFLSLLQSGKSPNEILELYGHK